MVSALHIYMITITSIWKTDNAEVGKQGKDKLERGADRGVRTVENKYNESEAAYNNMASGFFA